MDLLVIITIYNMNDMTHSALYMDGKAINSSRRRSLKAEDLALVALTGMQVARSHPSVRF